MKTPENRTADILRSGAADGWKFLYLPDRNIIRAYSKFGVTIMTVELNDASAEAEALYFDILTPVL